MAAPQAEREDGGREVGLVDGERMLVVGGKREARMEAILGVCDVPPERMTWKFKFRKAKGVKRALCGR